MEGQTVKDGICMMCHESPIAVRYIDLCVSGLRGFWLCKTCEDKIADFISKESIKGLDKRAKKRKEINNDRSKPEKMELPF